MDRRVIWEELIAIPSRDPLCLPHTVPLPDSESQLKLPFLGQAGDKQMWSTQ